MASIKTHNGENWRIHVTNSAKEVNLIDAEDNFTEKNVEGALREIAEKQKNFKSDQLDGLEIEVDGIQNSVKSLKNKVNLIDTTLVDHLENHPISRDGGVLPTITSTFADGTNVEEGKDVIIPIFFNSPNMGDGTAYVIIDGKESLYITVKQGSSNLNIGKLLNIKNEVSIYVKDRVGKTSNQLTWNIICGGIKLNIDFDYNIDYSINDQIVMPFTVTSVSDEDIIMHIKIDSDSYDIKCNQGYNEHTFVGLGLGVHAIQIYATSGVYISSMQAFNIVVVNSTNLYLSSIFEGGTFEYGNPISINYRISKLSDETFDVVLSIDGTVTKRLSSKKGSYYWNINDIDVGNHTLLIEVSSASGEYVKETFEVSVVHGEYIPVSPVKTSLTYWFDATDRTNQDSDRETWTDKAGSGIKAKLYNFNYSSNGWVDGTLVCDGNAYVEIPIYPYAKNATNGSTIDLYYYPLNIGIDDSCILDYTDTETPYKGVSVGLNEASLTSLTSKGVVRLSENEWIRLTFIIDRSGKFGKIFINGILNRVFYLSDSGAGVDRTYENFVHEQKMYINSKKGISHFGACKIKQLRIYDRALTDDEVLQNKLADITNLDEQKELCRFNYENNTTPQIRMYGDTSNMTNLVQVPMRVKYISTNDELYGQSFDFPACQVQCEGTSSLQYIGKNYTIYLKDENYTDAYYTPYKNGILENVFCLKCDYKDSTHCRDVGLAKFINDCLYDSKTPPQMLNENYRVADNGFPILLYINDELMGVYNFSLDRYSTTSFGYDVMGSECLVYEVSANTDTNAGAFYKYTPESGVSEDEYFARDFSCIYPINRRMGEDNFNEIKELVNFVSDADDSMFAEMFDSYFDKEYTIRYFLMAYFVGAVDNLGKNMKLCRFKNNGKWYPMFHDLNTTIGLNNSGFLKFTDSDIEMTSGVFNTSGSNLWVKLQRVFYNDIVTEYSKMRSNRFTLENIMKYIYDEQISKIPERYYNMDMQTKYLQFGSQYLYVCHGDSYHHIKKWLTERLAFMDTLFNYTVSSSDYITIRTNKSGYVYMDIQTYIPLYVTVKWRNDATGTGIQTLKVGKGETVRFSTTLPAATDQEIVIYGGQYLKDLGDLSNLAPTTMLISNANKLTKVKCSSPNLINTDLSQLKYLREIDLHGCTMLGTGVGASPTLNISNASYLTKIDIRDTKLTAIYTNPNGGNLQEIYYPESIQEIELANQKLLKIVGIPYGYRNVWGYQRPIENMQYNFTDVEILTELRGSFAFKDYSEVSDEKTYTIKADEYGFETSIYEFDENKNKIGSQTLSMDTTDNTLLIYTPSPGTKFININIRNTRWDGFGDLPSYFSSYRFTETEDIENFVECKLLNRVSMKNLTNIDYCSSYSGLDYKDVNGFYSFRYVQNLMLNNSLKLTSMNFDGFNAMKTVEIISMNTLIDLGFNNIAPVDGVSTIKSIVVSDCTKIKNLELNVTSEDYSVTFADNAVLDLSKAGSIKNIYSNCIIKGLKTIILPVSIENLYFTQEYGTGNSSIENIWSPLANHTTDGFVGMDLLGLNVKNINMYTLVKIPNIINMNLAPTRVNPNFNTARDGVNTPYVEPEGVLDLTNYTGALQYFFKGINLSKIELICDKTLTQTDFSYCFVESSWDEGTTPYISIVNRLPNNITNMDYMFYKTPIEIIDWLINKTLNYNATAKYMFSESKVRSIHDVIFGPNIDPSYMFYNCPELIEAYNLTFNCSKTISTFENCPNLTNIENVTIPGVSDMSKMYRYSGITNPINITSNVSIFTNAFAYTKIENIDGFRIENYPGYGNDVGPFRDNDNFLLFTGCDLKSVRNTYIDYSLGAWFHDMPGGQPSFFRDFINLSYIDLEVGPNCKSMYYVTTNTRTEYLHIKGPTSGIICDCGNICANIKIPSTTEVHVDLENIKPKSISYGFINCPSNIIFDRQLDTSELISAVSAFEACRKLKDLDISTWDLSKLILANEMFSLTDSLERIENHTLGTSLTNISGFCNGSGVSIVNFSGCDFSNVTDMGSLVYETPNLQRLDMTHCILPETCNTKDFIWVRNRPVETLHTEVDFSYSKYTTPFINSWIFHYVYKATFINTDFTECTDFSYMFSGSEDSDVNYNTLRYIDFTGARFNENVALNFEGACMNLPFLIKDFKLPNSVLNCNKTFYNCNNMTEICSNWNNTFNFKSSMITTDCYANCDNITTVDDVYVINKYSTGLDEVPESWGGFGFNKAVTGIYKVVIPSDDYTYTWSSGTQSGPTIMENTKGIINWGDGTITENETTHTYATAGTYIIKGHLQRAYNSATASDMTCLTEIIQYPTKGNFWGFCQRCSSLKRANITNLELSADTSAYMAFGGCTNLETIIGLNTVKNTNYIIDMKDFITSDFISELDLSSWEVPKCIEIDITNCPSLNILKLPQDTTNCEIFNFQGCSNIEIIENLNITSSVKKINFKNCSGLNSLNMDTWDMSGIISLHEAFRNTGFTILDFRSKNLINCTDFSYAFSDSINLEELYINFNNITKNLMYMCSNCPALIRVISESLDLSNVVNIKGVFNQCISLEEEFDFRTLNTVTKHTGAPIAVYRGCVSLKSITKLRLPISFTWTDGKNNVINHYSPILDCPNLVTITEYDVSFTNSFPTEFPEAIVYSYQNEQGFSQFNSSNFSSLTHIDFKGTLYYSDEIVGYPIFKGLDSSKLDDATWSSFVSIFPDISSTGNTKNITVGISMSIPDTYAAELVAKGYNIITGS